MAIERFHSLLTICFVVDRQAPSVAALRVVVDGEDIISHREGGVPGSAPHAYQPPIAREPDQVSTGEGRSVKHP